MKLAPVELANAERPTGDLYYAWEKFSSAVRHLSTSDGPWRARLREAYWHISSLGEADMPTEPDTIRIYRALVTRMTWAESTGEGTLPATLALISDREARAIASLFVDVANDLASAIIDAQRKGEIAALRQAVVGWRPGT